MEAVEVCIQELGGSINIVNFPGKGVKFEFYIAKKEEVEENTAA